jgi:DNA-binding response OmpR family regulator
MSPSVLIAEPNDDVCTAYERYLTRQGFTVFRANSLRECMEHTAAYSPPAVVCELDFPDGSIEEFLDSLPARDDVRAPAVFVASRYSQDRPVNKIHALVRDYYVKPFSMRKLVQALRAVVPASPKTGESLPSGAVDLA